MSARATLLALVSGMALAGCAAATGSGADPGAPPPAQETVAAEGAGGARATCRTGTVGVEGPGLDPRVVLRTAGSAPRPLAGPLARRIRLLTGATVTACGGPDEGPGEPIRVEAFQLRQVDGMEAHLGHVRRTSGRAELEPWSGGVPVPLAGSLEGVPGAPVVVWVAGRWEDGTFVVLSSGVLTAW